jgi:hypothetical protein
LLKRNRNLGFHGLGKITAAFKTRNILKEISKVLPPNTFFESIHLVRDLGLIARETYGKSQLPH